MTTWNRGKQRLTFFLMLCVLVCPFILRYMGVGIHIVADSKIPFLRGLLEPYAHISYYEPSEITNAVMRDADILLTRTRTRVDKRLLNGSRCYFVGTATIGYLAVFSCR